MENTLFNMQHTLTCKLVITWKPCLGQTEEKSVTPSTIRLYSINGKTR